MSRIFIAICFVLSITACADKEQEAIIEKAESACDCISNLGYDSPEKYQTITSLKKDQKKAVFDCIKEFVNDQIKDIKNSEDRNKLLRKTVKAILNTDCAVTFFETIDYEQFKMELLGAQ